MQSLKHRFRRAILLLAAGLVLLPAPARAEIKVGLSDWPGWVAWYVAEQKGYFKKYGASVKLVWFPNYTDSISALSTGQLDANAQTWSDTLAPLSKGLPLKVILVNDNSAGNDALMVSPKIKSFADLRGKKIALEEFSVSHFVLATALARNKMSLKDVQVTNLPAGDAAAAFIAGRVEAAVVWNPWVNQIQLSGKGRALYTSKDMPGLVPDLLVAQEKSLKAHRAEFVGMVRAWFDTQKFIHDHPAEASAIMSKVVGVKADTYRVFLAGTHFFDAQANRQAFGPASDKLSLLGVGPVIASFLTENKLLEGQVDYARALDVSVLNDALKH
jgi:NitT/TauT family transport system substrate-binding protein